MTASDFKDGKILPLIEEFYTIQGEGYHTGKAAYFIRIGGCDIGCRWCDSKYSWRADYDKAVQTEEILKKAASHPAKAIVVTGGEPLNYDMDYLTDQAKKLGLNCFLETSGAPGISGDWDWVCVSPKKNSPPKIANYALADELKVIIYEEADFDWAERCAEKVNRNCKLYLQPEWSRHKLNTQKIVNYILDKPKWELSLQTHKLINIP
jgi:7-carboxy-7-deazaguanine synthase